MIGDCGLELIELAGERVAELGYDFRSDHWNQGYATEAACAVRDYAFTSLRQPRLVSLIRPGNPASARVAAKTGLKEIDHIHTILKRGTSADLQLEVFRETNDLSAIVDKLIELTMENVPETAEVAVDCALQVSIGRAAVLAHNLPEHAVVGMTAAVVAHGGAYLLR